mgnify:CR=1 FL=1
MNIQISVIIWTVICFVALMLILRNLLFKPLLDVMDKTMAGEHIFPEKTPEVKLGLSTSYELTHSELDVIRALMQSTSDEDAASMLGCTKANIRWHVGKILDKTGYRTRMELLIAVAQKNLIIVTPDKALEENN